jgi:hypothetical protein
VAALRITGDVISRGRKGVERERGEGLVVKLAALALGP